MIIHSFVNYFIQLFFKDLFVRDARNSSCPLSPLYYRHHLKSWRHHFYCLFFISEFIIDIQPPCLWTQMNCMTSVYREMATVASAFLRPFTAANTSRCSLTVRLGHSTFSCGQYPRNLTMPSP